MRKLASIRRIAEIKQKVVTRTETEVDFYTFRNTWLVCELAFREILSDEKLEQSD